MCKYVNVNIYMCKCVYLNIQEKFYMNVFDCIYKYTYMYQYVCTCVHVYICLHMQIIINM
jgi:hypothetical protein